MWIGTRFIATPEAQAVNGYKDALLAIHEDGTVITKSFTGKTCRVVRNDWTNHFEQHPEELQPFPQQAFASAQAGVNHLGAPNGTVGRRRARSSCRPARVSARSTSCVPAGDLVRQMVAEAECGHRPAGGAQVSGSTDGLTDARRPRVGRRRSCRRCTSTSASPTSRWPSTRSGTSTATCSRAVELIRGWCAAAARSPASRVDVNELAGRTPLIVIEIPAFAGGNPDDPDDVVLLYGHLDKQPEMVGWRDGLGPWTPVIEDGRLYGRGGADDGYAAFASLLAIEAAQAAGLAHARCVVLIEASEESGSPDLPAHLESLRDRIGTPSLVLCLDSGCLDDQRLWFTTSLRGLVGGTLRVEILSEGVHSGEASGVVPSTFRIIRELLDRIEDSTTGRILLPELHVEIPADRRRQAADTGTEFHIERRLPVGRRAPAR